jgi:hypothetical protein
MKKFIKIASLFLLVILAILIVIPFAFEGKIIALVKQTANNNLNARLDFKDADLSLLKNFPKATVSIDQLILTNLEPFAGDTLVSAAELKLNFSIMELFKDASENIQISEISIEDAYVNIKIDSLGNTNYDIAKKDLSTSPSEATNKKSFVFDIESYTIKNSRLTYFDQESKIYLNLTDFNHQGQGIFSETASNLMTNTTSKISLGMDTAQYLSDNYISLDALIAMDLKNGKYSFLENQAMLNQLPLTFKGFVDINDTNQVIDITFNTASTDFKNFLAVMPKAYSPSIEAVTTTGDFIVQGHIKGVNDDTFIPTLDISMKSNNASFKYPDLPKTVSNITIDAAIKNETGLTNDTYIDVKTLNFKIDADEFKSSLKVSNLLDNPLVNAKLNGRLNLANISKAYPVVLENELKGIVVADLTTAFDMKAIESNNYARIKNKGTATLTDFVYTSKDIVNPIEIKKATITFNTTNFELTSFDAISGKSDIAAKGTITNLYGYLFSDKKLQGNFDVSSNSFAVSDFMVADEVEANKQSKKEATEALKIPAFLDVTLHTTAKTVYYDNLVLKDVKGILILKDENARLQEVSSTLFDGTIVLNGNVSTKEATPTFNMDLEVKNFDIAKSFTGMELLSKLAPIGKVIEGKFNTNLQLSGSLNDEFSPQLNTVTGQALAQLFADRVVPEQAKVLGSLNERLNFLNADKLNLKELKTKLTFNNGNVVVAPFTIAYQDIDILVDGSHSFDKSMDYKLTLNVPAKYLGKEITNLMAQIGDANTDNLKVPVVANITGSFTSPNVQTDIKNTVGNLTNQLMAIQKQKLKDKGTNLINDLINKNQLKNDSLKITTTNNAVKNVLGSILTGNPKTVDSTKTDSIKTMDPVKEAATDALKNLLKKKKKDTTTQKN